MSLKTFDMIAATLIKPSDTNPRGELTELKALTRGHLVVERKTGGLNTYLKQ